MIFVYACGGGRGHLNRVNCFLKTQSDKPFKVITASPFAKEYFREDQLLLLSDQVHTKPEIQQFIQNQIAIFNPHRLVIDVFPNGLLGEFAGFTPPSFVHVELLCRRVKWKKYQKHLDEFSMHFSKSWVYETLEPEHDAFVNLHSDTVVRKPFDLPEIKIDALSSNYWLIVHGGNEDEVRTLCLQAIDDKQNINAEVDLFLISEIDPHLPEIQVSKYRPAIDLFTKAERIYTAGGFNSIHETAPFRNKHICLPFYRKYDDQFWRKEQAFNE